MQNLNLSIAVNDRVWLWCLKNIKLRDGVYATETSSLRLVWTKYEIYLLHNSAVMYTFQNF